MKEKLTRNIGVKILSLLLAAFLWIVITNVDNPIVPKKLRNIPVEILNEDEITSPNLSYEIEQGKMIDIEVSARKSIADNLTSDDFKATADFALLSDVYATNIDIVSRKYGDDVVIAESSKNQKMKINIQEIMGKNFKVKLVTTGEVMEGYDIGELTSSPNIIRVTGPKARVESIDQVVVSVEVSDVTGANSMFARPKVLDKEGVEIDSSKLTFSVNYITVSLELYKTKIIDLNIVSKGEPAYGYAITSMDFEPKQIEISGKDSDLLRTNDITIELDVEGISQSTEMDISINEHLPSGINLVDKDEIAGVNISVEKMETKDVTIMPNDVELKNNESNFNFMMNSVNPMTVKVMGVALSLDDVSEKELRPYIDLSEYDKAGTYTANVKFDPIGSYLTISKPLVSFLLLP